MKILFLGTGTSNGVPVLDCSCPTCLSENKKNTRFRSSVIIKYGEMDILIDTPPELRLQLLEYDIKNIDLILLTHTHADHIMGFDDIRSINQIQNKSIPVYANERVVENIKRIFPYIFNPYQPGGGVPKIDLNVINKNLNFGTLNIQPLPVKHGKLDILGYKLNEIAYITDCSFISESTFKHLSDVKVLILGALRHRPHSTHMTVDEAVEVINKTDIKRAYLTHLSHDLEYEKENNKLPDHINLAYDGLSIYINPAWK